jgi:hypothetical protein
MVSRGSSVSIVSGYGLIAGRGERIFPLLSVQTGSGAHTPSHTVGTGGPFPGAKARPGRDTDHSPPSSAEVENEQELYVLFPQAPSWRVVGQV